jgi:Protoglobin
MSGTASSVPTRTCWPPSPVLTANLTRSIWRRCGVGLAAGSSTPLAPSSTRYGWTTSTKSAFATRTGKNRTDGVQAAEHIPLRYVIALLVPITTTLKPFLAEGGATAEEVEAMHQAWVKAVVLQVILWSYPYVREGDF